MRCLIELSGKAGLAQSVPNFPSLALASFERGEWQPSSKGKSEIARFAAMASASLAKDKRVTVNVKPQLSKWKAL